MMKFKSRENNLIFSSDLHINHKNFCRGTTSWTDWENCRDFDTLEEMNSNIFSSFMSLSENDILFLLGDTLFGQNKDYYQFFDQIPCKEIYHVHGNHENLIAFNKEIHHRVKWSGDILKIIVDDTPVIMSHRPFLSWEDMDRMVHLYGHCLDQNTEILTDEGWKKRENLKITNKCYSYNILENKCEWKPISEIIDIEYSGIMYNYNSKYVNFRTTDYHRHLLFDNNYYNYVLSKDLKNSKSKRIKLNGYIKQKGINLSDDLIKLYVWINADGHFEYKNKIRFHLKKERKIKVLCLLLDKLQIKYSKHLQKQGTTKIYFTIPKEIENFCYKPLDSIFTKMNIHQVKIFFDTYTITDGHQTYTNSLQISSCREKEIDIIQEIAIINGYMCNKIKKKTTENWVASINFNKDFQYCNFKKDIIEEKVDKEKVWCISTEYSNFLIRRNGKTHFTGNCHGQDVIPKEFMNDRHMKVALDTINPSKTKPRMLDVGVDNYYKLFEEYKYFTWKQIKEILK